MRKSLIVYYSWAGTTQAAAEALRQQTGAAVFALVPEVPYPADYSALVKAALPEKRRKARPAYRGTAPDPQGFDRIYLGYPNWFGDMPMLIYTYLEQNNFRGKEIAPFVTSGGSGLSETPAAIARLAEGAAVLPALSLTGPAALRPALPIADWLSTLG